MRADNSRHLITAAHQRAARTRRRAVTAIRQIATDGTPVSFDAVARAAGVSRSWLYAQPDLRAEIEHLRAPNNRRPPAVAPPERQRATDTSLLRRLEVATEKIRHLECDNRELRDALAQALGEQRQAAITGRTPRRDTPEKSTTKSLKPC